MMRRITATISLVLFLFACAKQEAIQSVPAVPSASVVPASPDKAALARPEAKEEANARAMKRDRLQPTMLASEMAAGSPPLYGSLRPEQMVERDFNTEEYGRFEEQPFLRTSDSPLSTFSIDVDTASYSNVRRFLRDGQLPPPTAVRVEEMVNYFSYSYPEPKGSDPFSVTTEVADCPWNPEHKLLHIGLQTKKIATADLPPANLVFLLDVSGSMDSPDKLPLVQSALELLVEQMREQDRVAIVVYAGAAGVVLPSTSGENKTAILDAIRSLSAGGSTAGGEGILLAYNIARENLLARGNNRVILATDGDFNVGVSSDGELERLIEKKRAEGIYLTVLGFGTGNIKDSKMELLADKGNGNYAYIDELSEARKVLVQEIGATLLTVAKDVKIQIEFNPSRVDGYRLIGYENRALRDRDFNDDTKDAGEIGAGHSVTALYEVVPPGASTKLGDVDPLKYQQKGTRAATGELATLKIRYKQPDSDTSTRMERTINAQDRTLSRASDDFKFAAAVAQLGLLLRESAYKEEASYGSVLALARSSVGADDRGDRAGFVTLAERAQTLASR